MDGDGPTAQQLRVVMVVRLFHPWVGGTEMQAQTLAEGLSERGVAVRVVTGRWFRGTPRREVIGEIPVFRNHTLWGFFGVRGLRRLGGYIYMVTLYWHLWRTRKSYDVIHIHGMNYHSAVAVAAGRRLGKPTVTKLANSGHASDVEKMRGDRQLQGARFLLPLALKCDRFVALNVAVRDELVAAGVSAARIVSLPNGVSLDGVVAKVDYATSVPAQLVYVGRLHEQKALNVLVEAISLLPRPSAVHVTLVGEGPHRDVLETLIARLELGDVVTLAGQRDDVHDILADADIFVLPSLVEGLSNALLEAMARGLPVVVSNIAGNVDVVENNVNGVLFECGRSRCLALRIQELLEDEPRRSTVGRGAAASVHELYALPAVVDRYIALYGELTTKG